MALTFPDSSASPFVAPNGVTYVWNTDGYWEASLDGAYLSKLTDDTAEGAITFEGVTTHEAGVTLTSGQLRGPANFTIVTPGGSVTGNRLTINEQNTGSPAFVVNSKAIASSASNAINLSLNYNSTITQTATVSNIFNQFSQTVPGNQDVFHNLATVANQQNTAGIYAAYASRLNIDDNQGSGGAYNFYAAGDAPNYFAGNVVINEASLRCYPNKIGNTQGDLFIATNTNGNSSGPIQSMALNAGGTVKRIHITFSASANDDGSGAVNIGRFQSTGQTGIRFVSADGNPVRIASNESTVSNAADINFNASSLVKLLQPKSFELGGRSQFGFLAPELKAHVPLAVEEDEEDGDGYDPLALIPILTKALQEALDKIETLETRLNDAGIA